MTFYLHYKSDIIADIEVSDIDIHVEINIKVYSQFLINNLDKQCFVIEDFCSLNEVRGTFFETPNNKLSPREFLRPYFDIMESKYGLHHTEH